MNEIKTYFGVSLKNLRKIRGYSQEQLAEKIGINRRQLTRIETGKSFPSFITLDKICAVLEISPSSLFDFSEYEKIKKTGTNNELFYVAQIKRSNLIVLTERLKNNNGKELTDSKSIKVKSEQNLVDMAKKLKRNIKVEYYKNNNVYRTVLYKQDGTYAVTSGLNELEVIIKSIEEGIKEVSNNYQKLKFIKLAIDCLGDKESLKKMQNTLEGMLLTLT